MRGRYWNARRDQKLRTMWGKYFTSEIGAALGCSKNAVVGRAYRLGLRRLAAGWTGPRSRTLDDKRIIKCYKSGLSLREIKGDLGCSMEGARQALIRNGVKLRPPYLTKVKS